MIKYILGFIALIIVIAVVVVLISTQGSLFSKKAELKVAAKTVTLEVADTESKRELGLSNRKALADEHGMLFLFDEPTIPSFWMKGMEFPLDIVFLNNKKIVTIYKNVPAPKKVDDIPTSYYQPTYPSDKVIELKAGAANSYNLHEGDTLNLSL